MDLNDRKAAGEDRISNLPDSLIHHILYFLEIKHVAQTSVLSKRWSYIWITVPNLVFEQGTCYDPDYCALQMSKFIEFVDGTLLRRDKMSDIQKFSFTQANHMNEYRVSSWITNLIRRNIQELILSLKQEDPFTVPISLCTCVSLISLKLEVRLNRNVCFPKCISFPKLKHLELGGVQLSNECWNEKLFSKCPVLEDLILEHCLYGTRNFYVSSSTLKFLKISHWDDEDSLQDCGLKIDAPNLVSFVYRGRVAKEFVLPNSPKLVEADVYFYDSQIATREQRISDGTTICQFLRALTHVKRLIVSDTILQALSVADDLLENVPTFHKTKQLIMTEEEIADKALISLLKATPDLESLVFDKIPPWSEDEEEGEVAGDNAEDKPNHDNKDHDRILDVVTPEFEHLKSVCFMEFVANSREIKWVQLILKNAKALETMTISSFHYSDLLNGNRIELMVQLTSLPRASASCLFKFPSWRS